jgi:hypothetical protein
MPQRTFDFSRFDIQANYLTNVGMENTSRRTGVDDRFKPFRARSIFGWQRNVDWKRGIIAKSALPIRKLLIGDF